MHEVQVSANLGYLSGGTDLPEDGRDFSNEIGGICLIVPRRQTKKQKKPDTIPEEELDKEVHVKSIELHKGDNCERHHTDRYECTESGEVNGEEFGAELVVRRGDEFLVTIELDRPYDKHSHHLNIVFKTGERPLPSKGTFAVCTLNEKAECITDSGGHCWGVRLVTQDAYCITVAVYSPPDCPIGEWEMIVKTVVRGQTGSEEATWYYECPEDITILLNPWCKDDAVYLPDEELLKEYILNDSGVCYRGSRHQITAKPCYYGQFDHVVLDAALFLLRKGLMFRSSSSMGDPVMIARALSKIVNGADSNNGVSTGSRDGIHEDGRDTTASNGSVKILRQYMEDPTQPVKHGQCWVNASLLTTVCRAVGLPCRSVTCFCSAHDSDLSLTVDKVFMEDDHGDPVIPSNWLTADSVWPFHVWNEVWTSRLDLDNTNYDGWQVVDSTPQKRGDGLYRIGPAPVTAVKSGDVEVDYDTTFVFAEVNADVIHWKQTITGELTAIRKITDQVGAELCTHRPTGRPYRGAQYYMLEQDGELEREIITNNYKHEEGSVDKLAAVLKATKIYNVTTNPCEIKQQGSLQIKIQKCDDVVIGADVAFSFGVTNRGVETRRVRTVLMVTPTCYRGVLRDTVHKYRFDDVDISPGDEKTFTSCLDGAEAFEKIGGSPVKVNAYAHVAGDTTETVEDECDFTFHIPSLIFEGPCRCHRNDVISVHVSFKNALHIALTGCFLDMEGSLECEPPTTNPLIMQDIPAGETYETEISLRARKSQRRKSVRELCASFYCNELPVINGKYDIELDV
ncbi:hemocyte protein-glutamine gamma-glutamyltransferase-like [Gigantopelta aegis]|uniref:hemocyte protein-glutamine gamma-glutamyltransferase-like n=1 Tax=Gigantopelta aegis TaxID=1735272 RepID=UPI001B88B6D8|nr:hemocyte protein-glutamine gamma-glutamyltransferase-like [Gigantopelta aegis]